MVSPFWHSFSFGFSCNLNCGSSSILFFSSVCCVPLADLRCHVIILRCRTIARWRHHCAINRVVAGRDVKSSRPNVDWPQSQNFQPRPCSIRLCLRPHAMLTSFSRKLSSWPHCQSLKSLRLCYVLL